MATSITLNNLAINSGNYRVHRIIHDGAPALDLNTLEVTREDGAKLISATYKPKTITIEGIIKGTSQSDLETNIDIFKKYISGTDLTLDIEYAGGTRRYNVAVSSVTITRDFFHLTFAPYSLEMIVLDLPFGRDTSLTETFSAVALTNSIEYLTANFLGSAKPRPKFNLVIDTAGTLEEIQLKNNTTNKEIILTLTSGFSNGDQIEIDCDEKTVKRNTTDFEYTGVFPEADLGKNVYQLSFIGGSAPHQSQTVDNTGYAVGGAWQAAQSFRVSSTTTYVRLDIKIDNLSSPYSKNLQLYIKNDNAGNPTGSTIVSKNISITSSGIQWISTNFSTTLTAGTTYWIVLTFTEGTESWYINWCGSTTNPYPNGQFKYSSNSGSTWTSYPNDDACFKIYSSASIANQSVDCKCTYYKQYL